MGTRLFPGDSIRTLSDGRCEIALSGRKTLKLESNAALTIPKSKYNSNEKVGYINLFFGKLWVGVKSLMGRSSRFVVRTPNALGGVKGTTFWVEHDNSIGKTEWALLEGKVEIHSRSMHARPKVLSPGEMISVDRRKRFGKLRRFDAEKALKKYRLFFLERSKSQSPRAGERWTKVESILKNQEDLLASMRRIYEKLAMKEGSKVSRYTRMTADSIWKKSMENGKSLALVTKDLKPPLQRKAKRRYEQAHRSLEGYRSKLLSQSTQKPAPKGVENDGASKRANLNFLKAAIRQVRLLARQLAISVKNDKDPRFLVNRLKGLARRTSRKYSRLRPIGLEAQRLYNHYQRELNKAYGLLGMAKRSPSTGRDDPSGVSGVENKPPSNRDPAVDDYNDRPQRDPRERRSPSDEPPNRLFDKN